MAPRRPRTRRSTRRKSYRRKRISNLWPATKVVKFRISMTKEFGSVNGSLSGIAYKANSLNDPTSTESTQLPLGLDQWAALYQKYKVLGSKINIMAHPKTVTGAGMIGIHLDGSSTLLTDHDHYREVSNTSMKMVSADIDLAKVHMTYSPKKAPFHLRSIKDADDQEGSFTASPGDPTDLAYYHVYVQDANKTDAVAFDIQVVMEFVVLLYDRVNPVRSSL